jgi:hypothetical protein
MIGDSPSGGVNMFALLAWSLSGPVAAPSSVCNCTRSAPEKPSKPSVARWSRKRLA